MSLINPDFDAAVAELRKQGLRVTAQSASNHTWYVKDVGLYTGYIVTGEELVELKSANRLNIHGIKALG